MVSNLERLIQLGIPTVTGTTGWDGALPGSRRLVAARQGALLHAANFSVGRAPLPPCRSRAGASLQRPARIRASISEEHHATKRDTPSGYRHRCCSMAPATRMPRARFPSPRCGQGPCAGTHTLTYQGPHETITLSHVARDREAFAAGALAAAEWLPGKVGVFTFEELLFGEAR